MLIMYHRSFQNIAIKYTCRHDLEFYKDKKVQTGSMFSTIDGTFKVSKKGPLTCFEEFIPLC